MYVLCTNSAVSRGDNKKDFKPLYNPFYRRCRISTTFIVWIGLERNMPLGNALSIGSLLLIRPRSPQVLPNRQGISKKFIIRNIFFSYANDQQFVC